MATDDIIRSGQEGGSILDRLHGESRLETGMLRPDEEISEPQRAAILRDLQSFKESTGKTWKQIGKGVGVSSTTLSEVASGSYNAKDSSILRRIAAYLANEDRQGQRVNIRGFVKTRVVELMLTSVRQAIVRRSMGVVTGGSGSGKTTLEHWLLDEYDGAVLITSDPKDGDSRFVVDALFDAFKINVHCRYSREKKRAIESYLQSHLNTLILVDEAQFLTADGLELLRSLHDKSDPEGKRNVPVILFGDDRFYKIVIGSRRGQRTPLSPQITSRLFPVISLELHCTERDQDGDPIPGSVFTREDIERIVRQQRLRLVRPEAIAFAVKLANLHGWGRLRLAARVLEIALDMKSGNQVSLDDMRGALDLFIGPSDARLVTETIEHVAANRRAVAAGA